MSGYFAVPMAHLQKLGLTSTEDNNDSIYNAVRNNNHSTRRSTSSCILMLAIALAILLGFSWGYFQAASGTLLTLLSPPLLSNRIYGNQSLFDETGAALYDYKNSPIYQEEKQNMRKVGDQKSLESGSPADLERAKKEASKISGTMVVDTSKIQHSSSGKARWETYAIALKSGKGIALGRIPVQLLTFLKDVENILVLGESPGISVGTHEMLDVCTHLYDKYKDKPANWNLTATSKVDTAKQQSDKIVPDIQSLGWKLDAHKNLPGFKVIFLWKWWGWRKDDIMRLKMNLYYRPSTIDFPKQIGS